MLKFIFMNIFIIYVFFSGIAESFRDYIIDRHSTELINVLSAEDTMQHYSMNVK